MKNEESDNLIIYATLDLKRKNSGDLENKNKKHKKEEKVKKNNTYILFVSSEDEQEPRIYEFNAYNKYLKKSMDILIDLYDADIHLHTDVWNMLFFISEFIDKYTKKLGLINLISKKVIRHNFDNENMIQEVLVYTLPKKLLKSLCDDNQIPFIKQLEAKDIAKYGKKKTLIAYVTDYC